MLRGIAVGQGDGHQLMGSAAGHSILQSLRIKQQEMKVDGWNFSGLHSRASQVTRPVKSRKRLALRGHRVEVVTELDKCVAMRLSKVEIV